MLRILRVERPEYIDETTLYEVLEAGRTMLTFDVPTKAPTTGLLDGVLEATIVNGIGYTPVSGSDVDYVEVYDLTSPADILSVSAESASIVEGQDAVFNISRTRSAGSTGAEVSFQYNLTFSDDNFYGGTKIDVASTIPAGMDERKITISTTELTGSDPFPTSTTDIRLSLENTREFSTADYRINQKSDTIDITENLPVVSIKNYPTNITIGHEFSFTVEANQELANPLTVGLDFSFIATGLFASIVDSENNAITNSVTLPTTGSNKITVTTAALATPGDQVGQFFDLASGTGYSISTVAAERQPTLNFLDNSSPTAARPNVALQTYGTDTVAVASATELTFNIIATPVPSNDVDVNVEVSESGGNFLSSSTVAPVRLSKTADQTMTPFTVAIADDDTDTENGDSTITVALTHGDGYTLVATTADPNHTTSATVTDVVPVPVVSITGLGGSVTQGHSFSFTVEATTTLTNPLPVVIGIEDQNSGAIVTGATPSGVFIPDDSGVVMVPISGSIPVVVTTVNPGALSGNVTGNVTLYPPAPANAGAYQLVGGATSDSQDVVF